MPIQDKLKTMLSLATPPIRGGRIVQMIVAGASGIVLVGAGAIALGSLAVLAGALLIIYVIATEILGIELELDPAAFAERMRAYTQPT